jgi:dTDP-D-glucose 4,6-dehydratase
VLWDGRVGEVYNLGGSAERANLEVAEIICPLFDGLVPDSPYAPHGSLITFVEGRPGHDRRYAIEPPRSSSAGEQGAVRGRALGELPGRAAGTGERA